MMKENKAQEKERLIELKKALAEQLRMGLKKCDDDILEELIKHGYSSVEIIQMLTKYENASGLDLINCNHVVEETLSR